MFQIICNPVRGRAYKEYRFCYYHWNRWMEVQRLLRGLTPKERGAGGALMVLAGIMSREEEAALALLDRDSFDSLLIEHYGGAVKWLRKAKRAHATARRQIWDGNMHVLRERMERAVERCHGPAVVYVGTEFVTRVVDLTSSEDQPSPVVLVVDLTNDPDA